jgi:hypothetical protein
MNAGELNAVELLARTVIVVVAIMLGSIMTRGINGSGELVPALISGAALVAVQGVQTVRVRLE